MNGKRKLKVRCSVYILMSLCLTAVLLGGCGKKQIQKTDNEEEVVEIPMILTVSPTSGKKSEQELVDAFNITYKGKYHIAVEWIMETESDYRQNLKRLNVTDKLPAVITDLRMLPSYYRLLVEDHRIVDLAPYIEADQEWKQMIEPVVLDSCSEEDGSVYLGPVSTAAFPVLVFSGTKSCLSRQESRNFRRRGRNSGIAARSCRQGQSHRLGCTRKEPAGPPCCWQPLKWQTVRKVRRL
mgnify:CR=1 FL=1